MRTVHYEIYPAGSLPVAAVSPYGDFYWLNGESSDTVVAHVDGAVVGVLAFTRRKSRQADIHVIWVYRAHRGAGVGRQMLALLDLRFLRAETITDDGYAFFRAMRSNYKVRIYDHRSFYHTLGLLDKLSNTVNG